jgi:hypothetical protein
MGLSRPVKGLLYPFFTFTFNVILWRVRVTVLQWKQFIPSALLLPCMSPSYCTIILSIATDIFVTDNIAIYHSNVTNLIHFHFHNHFIVS